MPNKTARSIYWTPRIISILFLCFLTVFSLDVITPEASAGEIALGLFMHNIPVFVLAAVLAISWKREIIAGVVFTVVGLLFLARTVMTTVMNGFAWAVLPEVLLLAGPSLLVGILFIVNWRKRAADRSRAAA